MTNAHTSAEQAPIILGYGFTTHRPGPIWPCDSEKTAREVASVPHLRPMQRTVEGWTELPVERPSVILTKDAVTLYDIETNSDWRHMSVREGEQEVATCHELGDTVQEYDTTDRAGNPLRVVLQIDAPSEYAEPDRGGVYVFTR
jgi:hypothetical protein